MRFKHSHFLATFFGLLLLFAAPSAEATLKGTTIETNGNNFTVEVNEGKLIRLDDDISSVFIANPNFADVSVKSTKLLYIFGKTPGETTLYAIDGNENIVVNMKIIVHHNLSRLQSALDQLIGPQTVTATSLDGSILLTGAVPLDIQAANAESLASNFIGEGQSIINQIQVTAPNQINIRVRFAEVQRDFLETFGFDFFAGFTSGSNSFGLQALNPSQAAQNAAFSFLEFGNFNLDFFIDALADDDLVSILAEPNLTAISGETASFLAGGEFPVPSTNEDGNITVEFKQFGVSLSFTPTMISNNRISLRVRPEVSALSSDGAVVNEGFSIPALTTRRADTTVEIGSGQSFAIAGLILDNSRHNTSEFPGLADLPILGRLFSSDRFERSETELVIVVTPYIVQPVSPDKIALPTDNLTVRQQEGPQPNPATAASSQMVPLQATVPAAQANKSVGFIIE